MVCMEVEVTTIAVYNVTGFFHAFQYSWLNFHVLINPDIRACHELYFSLNFLVNHPNHKHRPDF